MEGGEFSAMEFDHGENFPREGAFRGVNFPGEIFHWSNLPEFLYEIIFICLTLYLPTQFHTWGC